MRTVHSNLSTIATKMSSNLKIELRQLRPDDEAVFISSRALWPDEASSWFSFISPEHSYKEMLGILENERLNRGLAPDRVAATMLYAFVTENEQTKIIGRFHIRHALNNYLLARGGHVGYAVAPSYRQQGVASEMMRQGLEYIRQNFSHEKILITCTDSNAGSVRLIEKFGGVLENKTWDDGHQEVIRRYWLKL